MYRGKVEGRFLRLFNEKMADPLLECCLEMAFHIKEKERIIVYEPAVRRIGIRISDSVLQLIRYCPWCASKLPEDLGDELSKIVFDKLGLDGYDDPRLPEEFKSDEWWKKRGL